MEGLARVTQHRIEFGRNCIKLVSNSLLSLLLSLWLELENECSYCDRTGRQDCTRHKNTDTGQIQIEQIQIEQIQRPVL